MPDTHQSQTAANYKGSAFNWEDPFLLDDQLEEDERMIRDAAAAFAADKLLPRIERAYLDEGRKHIIFTPPPPGPAAR